MSWKRWKIGLAVSLLSGLFTGLIGLAVGLTHQQVIILLVVNMAKDGLLYLKDHPIDNVDVGTSPPFKVDDTKKP